LKECRQKEKCISEEREPIPRGKVIFVSAGGCCTRWDKGKRGSQTSNFRWKGGIMNRKGTGIRAVSLNPEIGKKGG